jgi:pimeloyl-ACP methyl ester carboxylesterase
VLTGSSSGTRRLVPVGDTTLEVDVVGSGRPIVLLHPGFPAGPIGPKAAISASLSADHTLMLPIHPGFGDEPVPPWMTSVDDLAFFYLDFLESATSDPVTLVGASFGAWVAAATAVMSTSRVERLVLVDPVGIKISDRETRDIVDLFSLTDSEIAAHAFADAERWMLDSTSMNDAELASLARARTATARYGWSPYLHDPKLKRRLARIDVPTLVVSGSADRVVSTDYAQAFAKCVTGSSYEVIDGAGHFPHLERPAELAALITAFMSQSPDSDSG